MSRFDIEILPDGRWRNKYPDYVVFNDHIKAGEHSCPECKCTYCQAPSIFNVVHLTNKTDGRSAGFMYCLDCLMKEHKKATAKAEEARAKAEEAKAKATAKAQEVAAAIKL